MTSSYAPAYGCDAVLNAWCNAHCPHFATHGPLLARFDVTEISNVPAWRCYASSTLSPDLQSFRSGNTFCTRHGLLLEELRRCTPGSAPTEQRLTAATIDASGRAAAHMQRSQPRVPGQVNLRVPASRQPKSGRTPRYVHETRFMQLPPTLKLPRVSDCGAELAAEALFWGASMFTSSYAHKAQRLEASCTLWRVCCSTALVPNGAFDGEPEGSYRLRHRLIATKPLFILSTLRLSPLPLVWLDVDLEFHAFPTLFTPAGWADVAEPRDVLLWNWQANVSAFSGRRLKMASGVAWFNKTSDAEALLVAWAEAMAYEPNAAAPDDQALDLLINDDGWIDRANYGWLPESYLRMMPRHKDIAPVIDHDRGAPVSGKGKNSPIEPTLPPRRSE